MASATSELNILVRLKDEASKSIEGIKDRLESMEPTFKKMAVGGTAVFAGLTAVGVSAVKGFIADTKDMAIAGQALNNTLENMSAKGLNAIQKKAGEGVDIFDHLNKKMGEASESALKLGYDDETASIAFAKLFSVTGDATKAQEQLKLAMDLSAYSGKDLESTTQAIIMAHTGSTKVLKEFGIVAKEGATVSEVLALAQAKVGGSAETMAQGLDVQAQILQLRFENIKSAIGGVIVEALEPLMAKIVPLIEKFTVWAEENPRLITTILAVTAGLAGVVAVVGTLGLVLPSIIAGFTILAGPVGIIIAILGVLVLTVRNVVKIYEMLRDDGKLIWEGIKIYMKEAVQWIYDNSLGKLIGWIDTARNALTNLWASAKDYGGQIAGKIGGAITAPFSGRANGGSVYGGMPYRVGERGPEIFMPTQSGTILPAGGGPTINLYLTGNEFVGREGIAERITDDITNALKLRLKL